ncbi:MAG: hypothetical protein AAFQ21_04870 [Pseudomonadota bacterium]
MVRYLLYGVFGLTAAVAIAFGMALQYGLDPFDSRLTLYWGVILLVGLYITLRIALMLEKRRIKRKREAGGPLSEGAAARAARKGTPNSLEARMAARRERVRRAQEKAEQSGASDSSTE